MQAVEPVPVKVVHQPTGLFIPAAEICGHQASRHWRITNQPQLDWFPGGIVYQVTFSARETTDLCGGYFQGYAHGDLRIVETPIKFPKAARGLGFSHSMGEFYDLDTKKTLPGVSELYLAPDLHAAYVP